MPRSKDIVVQMNSEGSFFNTYRDVSEVGNEIFKCFREKFVEGKGFPLAENDKRYGIISNLMGLSAILELESMGAEIGSFDSEFKFLLQTIFDSLYSGRYLKGKNLQFGASPYLLDPDGGEAMHSYVETASKVFIIFLDLRNYAIDHDVKNDSFGESFRMNGLEVDSFVKLIELTEEVILTSTRFLVDSALNVSEDKIKKRMIDGVIIEKNNTPAEMEYRGWTFCAPNGKDDEFDTSIYYTYHGTNAFVSLFNAYPDIMDCFMFDRSIQDLEVKQTNLTNHDKEVFARNVDFIQNNKELFNKFRIVTNSSGRYIEEVLKEKKTDIAFDFVKSDFSGVSTSGVLSMQDSNAVINTMFIVAIFLNAAVDEDYEWLGTEKIDWFFSQLQFSITNIRRIYITLRADKRQELVESFNLYSALLSEKCPASYKEFMQKFRRGCRNVAVYDLIPLLCNTYSIIFDYLIKYPQREMIDNLELIMDNCDEDEWLWGDANGFSINNHMYYIFALENFYKYYNEYEAPLSGNINQYNKIVREKTSQFEKSIDEERERANSLRRKNAELEEELKNKKSEIETIIEKITTDSVERVFNEKIDKYLNELLSYALEYYLSAVSKKSTNAKVENDLKNDIRLRNAFALFGAVQFNEHLIGDLNDYDKNSQEYHARKNDNLTNAIIDVLNLN